MSDNQNIRTIPCPECDNEIKIEEELQIGDIIECTTCGTESEILSVMPLEIAPLEEEK